MEPKLTAGTFYGKTHKQRRVRDIGLTESVYSPSFMIPKHSHESAYFGLVLQGTYRETFERRTRECRPYTLLFHPAGELHAERHDEVVVRIFNIELSAAWRDRVPEKAAPCAIPAVFDPAVVRLALGLYEESRKDDPGRHWPSKA